jgi:hyperosmotically inducible protein
MSKPNAATLICAVALVFSFGALSDGASDIRAQSRSQELLEKEVRKQLLKLPYLTLFDWIEAQIDADKGTVVLRGQVVRATTRKDAERRVKKLEGVTNVANEIEVLPPSPSDARIRRAIYREVFGPNSPLFRYANAPIPSIHIIVKNGHVVLKGSVGSALDKQVAYARASIVPGIFDVKNDLVVEK